MGGNDAADDDANDVDDVDGGISNNAGRRGSSSHISGHNTTAKQITAPSSEP